MNRAEPRLFSVSSRLGALLFSLLLLDVSGLAGSIVRVPGDFPTIQAAVEAAAEGDTVLLAPGEYLEQLAIWKSLTLSGEDAERVFVSIVSISDTSGVTVSHLTVGAVEVEDAEQVTLDGLAIGGPLSGTGVKVAGQSRVRIAHSTITDCLLAGITVGPSARVEVDECTISRNGSAVGVLSDGEIVILRSSITENRREGLTLGGTAKLVNCTVSGNEGGIGASGLASVEILGCSLSDNREYGVLLIRLAQARMVDCGLRGNKLNVVLQGSAQAELVGCAIEGGDRGIWLEESSQAVLVDCVVSDNTDHGVAHGSSGVVCLDRCTVARNGYGLALAGEARAVITMCSIVENALGVVLFDYARMEISNSEVTQSLGVGVLLGQAAHVQIDGCSVSANVCGIRLRDESTFTCTNSTISENETDGLQIRSSAMASVVDCQVLANRGSGIRVEGSARAEVSHSNIANNSAGVLVMDLAEIDLKGCRVTSNETCGVAITTSISCLDALDTFGGRISGKDNLIPEPGETEGNGMCAVFPPELGFLVSTTGGSWAGLTLQRVRLVLQAQGVATMKPEQRQDRMNAAATVLRFRLDGYRLARAAISLVGTDQIEIDALATRPMELKALVTQTGLLEVRKVLAAAPDPSQLIGKDMSQQEVLPGYGGRQYFSVEALPGARFFLTGAVVDKAEVCTCADERFCVALTLTRAGADFFADWLQQLEPGDQLAIVIDGVVYSVFTVSPEIKKAAEELGWTSVQHILRIEAMPSCEEANLLSLVLNWGPLPFELTIIEEEIQPEGETTPSALVSTQSEVHAGSDQL